MKCQEVEALLFDLARGKEAPAEALRHLDACPHCAALVSAEQSISAALRMVVGADRNASAPERVETALLAAFRAQTATAMPAPLLIEPAKTRASWLALGWLWQRKLIFASACVVALVLLVVALLRFQLAPPPGPAQTANTNLNLPHETHTPTNADKEEQRTAEQPEQRDSGPSYFTLATASHPHSKTTGVRSDRQTTRPRARAQLRYAGTLGEMEVLAHARDVEHVTPFVPLVAGGAPLASGQVVRVSVPPSALASLGLPVNPADSANVKADVLLGEDGQARAIRFVH